MNLEHHPASESIGFLKQGAELIRTLDDDVFTRAPGAGFRGGVGGQFRHCIDFYQCLLNALEQGNAVDYANREREAGLETDREVAAARFEQIAERLAATDPGSLDRSLQVRSETPMPGVPEWCGSTVYRELQFLVSHTVHHYALIVALLGRLGYELEPRFADFGVAPSTLAHWKEAGPLAG
jgi:uncharacterized damage-inducible protein DinB